MRGNWSPGRRTATFYAWDGRHGCLRNDGPLFGSFLNVFDLI
jgi:hypothetical protein